MLLSVHLIEKKKKVEQGETNRTIHGEFFQDLPRSWNFDVGLGDTHQEPEGEGLNRFHFSLGTLYYYVKNSMPQHLKLNHLKSSSILCSKKKKLF